jgi:hypothetical protein
MDCAGIDPETVGTTSEEQSQAGFLVISTLSTNRSISA